MLYRKPPEICRIVRPEVETVTDPEISASVLAAERRAIEQRVAGQGYRLRLGTVADADAIMALQVQCWPRGHPALEERTVLWRMLSWGFCPLIVKDPTGAVVAVNLNEGYTDEARTSFGVRVSVAPDASGHNFGAELARYSAILGAERGSQIRRGMVGLTNYPSAMNTLNHVGFVADAFHLDEPAPGVRGFALAMPLTPGGILNNRVDLEKAQAFVRDGREFMDYVLLGPTVDEILDIYEHTYFRVVALLPAGCVRPDPTFLAVPVDCK